MPIRAPGRYGYAHLIAAICFSIQALGVGAYIAFGVFFNPLMEEFGWSRAAISGASSLAFFIMALAPLTTATPTATLASVFIKLMCFPQKVNHLTPASHVLARVRGENTAACLRARGNAH